MFVGRERQLQQFNMWYEMDSFQMPILYGRRRVGKTAFITKFIEDKDAIFFTAQETNAKDNLAAFSREILKFKSNAANATFNSFNDALEVIFELSKTKRIILVIDEYPYLAESYKGISSIIQTFIDKYKDTSKLFIILCGSSISFMEGKVLGYKSPLFGRRTGQIKMEGFDYLTTLEYFKNSKYSKQDLAIIYAITGGIPLYISLINSKLSLKENIKNLFLTVGGYLFDEPSNLLKQEFREPAQYNAVIKAVANGASKMNEISGKVGLESGLCSSYISKLVNLGIIKKEYPVLEENSKRTIYSLKDTMFKFWYCFVPDNISLIEMGQADVAYNAFENQITAYMGSVFEEISKQYLWKLNIEKKLSFMFRHAGRWWGNNPITKSECEIDILAYDDKKSAIFAECKWTNEKVGMGILTDLKEKSSLFQFENKEYFLFSKSGFTNDLIELANKDKKTRLFNFEDLM